MLPKENRLKKKKDFENVFKRGKGVKENFLFFKWTNNNLKESRFGFVVGKKFSKKAVVRNRIKRRIREVVRINLPQIKKGIDGVFIINPGLEADNFQKVEVVVNAVLSRAKVFLKND